MKVLRKIKEEKGSITMTTVAVLLFMTAAVAIASFSLSNQSNDQNKKIKQTSNSYKVTNSQLIQEYKDVQDNLNDITTMSITQTKALGNIMLAKGTNTETMDTDGNKIIIPGGFKIVVEENVVTDKVENGFVIEDKNQNQWVWIPVSSEDLAKMYESGNTEYTLLGTDVKTTYKTKGATLGNATISRGNPGEYDYREPDVLSFSDMEQTYRGQAGFGDLDDMATKLKDDYEDMIESIKINGGFYVGRYELSGTIDSPTEKKSQAVLTNKTWYELYKACKIFSGERVESRMIWGCQWDQVCRFISSYKNSNNETVTRSLDDSRTYGNYKNSQSPADVSGKGSKQAAGYSEYWKINNIYDLAGNCLEWTQEAFNDWKRVDRGGCFSTSGNNDGYSVASYIGDAPNTGYNEMSSRPVLYIK